MEKYKIKTLQIKLLQDDYYKLSELKKKMKAKNWYDFTIKVLDKGDSWQE